MKQELNCLVAEVKLHELLVQSNEHRAKSNGFLWGGRGQKVSHTLPCTDSRDVKMVKSKYSAVVDCDQLSCFNKYD
jgi:hypothetical protein